MRQEGISLKQGHDIAKFNQCSTKMGAVQFVLRTDQKELDQKVHQCDIAPEVSEGGNDPWSNFRGRIHRAIYHATCRTIFGHDLRVWYAILLELGSLFWRIRILRAHKLYRYGIDLGPGMELTSTGHAMRCKRTRARMNSIRYLLAKYPPAMAENRSHLSLVDNLLILEGWDMGERFGRREHLLEVGYYNK